MFLIDTVRGRIVRDDEIKAELVAARPYKTWLDQNLVHLDDLPPVERELREAGTPVQRQQLFGYTLEELKMLVAPMARDAKEAIGSMGTDTPVAALSNRPRQLFDYFQQLFAQVTNPPLDAIREELITAVCVTVGSEGNLLDPGPQACRRVYLSHPVITEDQLGALIGIESPEGPEGFRAKVLDARYAVAEGKAGLTAALDDLRTRASAAIANGVNILVISDRGLDPELAPIPSLLATGAVHHHLIRACLLYTSDAADE